jgi:uncharacterized protein YciI
MKISLFLICLILILIGCEQPVEKVRGIPAESRVKVETPDIKTRENELKQKGYQTFTYKEGDSTYLMQQYYLVFLKKGKNRNQDSLESASLQEQHLAHLNRMYQEGFSSLAGPLGDDGDIRGIVVYNTATLKEADSLARLDPMVKAGRLKVEVHPWWAVKGGKLN